MAKKELDYLLILQALKDIPFGVGKNLLVDYLKGNENDPRVVYEHSLEHNSFGTARAFESLPLFSGRSTLEGLYIQSTPTSPFVFYIESEVSKIAACPFLHRRCTTFNLENGTKHLKLFNVQHYVALSDQVKNALKNNTEYRP